MTAYWLMASATERTPWSRALRATRSQRVGPGRAGS
jgi:hypothetical protein